MNNERLRDIINGRLFKFLWAGDLDGVKSLLAENEWFDLKTARRNGIAPLSAAASTRSRELVQYLLDIGEDPYFFAPDTPAPFVQLVQADIVPPPVNGRSIDYVNMSGFLAVITKKKGAISFIEKCLSSVQLDPGYYLWRRAFLLFAFQNGNSSLIEWFSSKYGFTHPDLCSVTEHSCSSAMMKDTPFIDGKHWISIMLDAGAPLNDENDPSSFFHVYANKTDSRSVSPALIDEILRKGVDSTTLDREGNSPLHYLMRLSDSPNLRESLSLIVKNNPESLYVLNSDGDSPLDLCYSRPLSDYMECLLSCFESAEFMKSANLGKASRGRKRI